MTSTIMVTAIPGQTSEVCATGATRSTSAVMALRRSTLLEIAAEARPASVRHIYYRAVVAGLVEKRETGYRKVQRQLLALRRSGDLPFDWITDEGRRAHWPLVEDTPSSALTYLAATYRRDPWQEPGSPRVEIWCESESIAGVLMPLKIDYAVPIFPLKGQGSETFVWSAASSYAAGEQVVVLYAGDYDPAGLQIGAQLEGKLLEYGHRGLDLDFRRVAINHDQATRLQPLGTPPKQHHWVDYVGVRHEFVGQAIEAEAVAPKVLRNLFSTIIEEIALEAHGRDVFAESRVIENADRESLAALARGWGGAR